jgi:hypothetical protein
MLLGNNQQMGRCLRIDVRKDNTVLILVHTIGGDGTGYDFAEQTIYRHGKGDSA